MKKLIGLAAATVAGIAAVPAGAVTITRMFDFTVTDIVAFGSPAPTPVDPVTGSITVTFDSSVAVFDQTSGITLNSLNLSISSPLEFSYIPLGDLTIGASNAGLNMLAGADDFFIAIHSPLLDTPLFDGLGYTRAGILNNWGAGRGSGSVTARTLDNPTDPGPGPDPDPGSGGDNGGVPEPATWGLMILGFGTIGAALRRRHSAAAT